jgi:hypothetical protein
VCGLKFRDPVVPAAGPNVSDGKRVAAAITGGRGPSRNASQLPRQ